MNLEEAKEKASKCLGCANPKCMEGCPIGINIPEFIKYIKEDCLLIDLASNPGGIDKRAAKDRNLKLIWALALPGKVAPITTAEFIKETVYNILKEIYKK